MHFQFISGGCFTIMPTNTMATTSGAVSTRVAYGRPWTSCSAWPECVGGGGGTFQFSHVEDVAQEHCNCKFAKQRNFGAVIVVDKEIRLSRHAPTELLANYGIESYWLGFFAHHCVELGFDHPMVKIILWFAASPQSHLPEKHCQTILHAILASVQVPSDIIPPYTQPPHTPTHTRAAPTHQHPHAHCYCTSVLCN